MSLGIRPILRPVVWSDVDSNGKLKRRGSSASSDDDTEANYSSSREKKKTSVHTFIYRPPPLSPSETVWSKRCEFLFQKGYQLRPRYQPQWDAGLLGNGTHSITAEDHIMQILPRVLDAIRRQDGLVVCLKLIQDPRKVLQIRILDHFSTRRMTSDTRNHVVPRLDSFPDYDPNLQFIVMPVLRRFDDPEFVAPCEVVDFISQALEGLAFLHGNSVAHHNLNAEHIMMDAKAIIPTGWHFVSHFCEPDGVTRISPLERRNFPVRYYFVGFGNAYHLPHSSKQQLVTDIGGEDEDVPELRESHQYDPFKLDIYTLGNVFKKELYNKYYGLDFISDLLVHMHKANFTARPTAEKLLREWYNIRLRLDEEVLETTRLRPKGMSKRPTSCRQTHIKQSSPSGSIKSTRSGSARSNKRDISSILNMVGLLLSDGTHHNLRSTWK